MIADPAHLSIGLLCAVLGIIFLWTDRRSDASRALAVCLLAIASLQWFSVPPVVSGFNMFLLIISQGMEAIALIAGVEWGRRVARTETGGQRMGKVVNGLMRAAQLLLLVYGGLSMGYVLIAPESAIISPTGAVRVRAIEFAVFAPVLGTAMLLAGLAIILLLFLRIDPIERVRLRALLVAGPPFIVSMIISEYWEPLVLALGLSIFLAGAVRYLMIQSQRGQFMRQFLSPELTQLLNEQGMSQPLLRERRRISVLACDLRGFTAFARQTDSSQVIALLERYYAKVGQLAAAHGGAVKDHAGDGLLILLGAPLACEDYTRRALDLAQDIVAARATLLAGQDLGLGIGIATGRATVGAIQGAGRLEYVAVGTVVNLAARLCDRAADGEILVDQRSFEAARQADQFAPRPAETLKGFAQPVSTYALLPGKLTQKQDPTPGEDSTLIVPP